jgi:Icc-related predicted phosphoesterase
MKLLLFSDLHADVGATRSLVQRAGAADVVVGAGDFGNMRQQLDVCIDILREIKKPMVFVPGNAESAEELAAAVSGWPATHVLHGTGVSIASVPFFGVGGAIPVTPFGPWSYDFSEEQAASLLARCPAGCVLVSHSPPKGAVDRSSRGASIGSTAVRDAVVRTSPRLVVCGHVHASGGQREMLGKTPVVNAGPGGIDWELDA